MGRAGLGVYVGMSTFTFPMEGEGVVSVKRAVGKEVARGIMERSGCGPRTQDMVAAVGMVLLIRRVYKPSRVWV